MSQEEILAQLAHRLRSKRKQKGLTLKQVSESCSISISLLSDIELGKADPSLKTLLKLASCYETGVADLFIEGEVEAYIRKVRLQGILAAIQTLQTLVKEILEGGKEP